MHFFLAMDPPQSTGLYDLGYGDQYWLGRLTIRVIQFGVLVGEPGQSKAPGRSSRGRDAPAGRASKTHPSAA